MISRWGNKLDCFALARNDGFTLAEVLITLGIIGVVAAMTIPNLITAHQKKVTVTKLQKAISEINQAYKLSYEENGDPTFEQAVAMGGPSYYETYWQPYIKSAQYCTSFQNCGYSSNNPWQYSHGGNSKIAFTANHNDGITFYTPAGFLYMIRVQGGDPDENGNTYSSGILVDINGSAGPNKLGRDAFQLTRISNGVGVVPFGPYEKRDINEYCIRYGLTCAEKIRQAGWQIEKDYPW